MHGRQSKHQATLIDKVTISTKWESIFSIVPLPIFGLTNFACLQFFH
jgi:hypothetical protein